MASSKFFPVSAATGTVTLFTGWQPDGAIVFGSQVNSANGVTADAAICLGFASRANSTTLCVTTAGEDNVASASADQVQRTHSGSVVLLDPTTLAVGGTCTISWATTGITVALTGTQRMFGVLVFEAEFCEVFQHTIPGSTGAEAIAIPGATGATPNLILTAWTRSSTISTNYPNGGISLGAADGTSQFLYTCGGGTRKSPTQCGRGSYSTACMGAMNTNGTRRNYASFDSFAANTINVTWDQAAGGGGEIGMIMALTVENPQVLLEKLGGVADEFEAVGSYPNRCIVAANARHASVGTAGRSDWLYALGLSDGRDAGCAIVTYEDSVSTSNSASSVRLMDSDKGPPITGMLDVSDAEEERVELAQLNADSVRLYTRVATIATTIAWVSWGDQPIAIAAAGGANVASQQGAAASTQQGE